MELEKKRVVVLGGGFAGLTFCQKFFHPDAEVVLIDRQNHHLFQPLLYQVATAGLSAPDIAKPIRSILNNRQHVSVLMDSVEDFDLKRKRVVCEGTKLDYDYLVVGLGGVTSYFGNDDWAEFAPGLKSLDDAIRIRRDLLLAFERSEAESDPVKRERLLTMVVVGGGPTGVELAGAFVELAKRVLKKDFKNVDLGQARIILIEGGDRVLGHLAPELSESARKQLERLGVEVRTHTRVSRIEEGKVRIGREVLHAGNIIWAAGVGGSPLAKRLGVETDRSGRVKVEPDCSVPGYPEVFVVGDMAHLVDANGVMVPGVSPAAIQMAEHVSGIIRDDLNGIGREHRPAFTYWDKGTMATIGRSAAVAQIGQMQLAGFMAWLAWLGVHLLFLIGFRNKIAVFLQWVYSYVTYRRGARIIMGATPPPERRFRSIPSRKTPARKKKAS